MAQVTCTIKLADHPRVLALIREANRRIQFCRRLALVLFFVGLGIGLLAGCSSPPPAGPATYECDSGHQVLRVFPNKPGRDEVILLPFNPCGFKA